ncbi:MAG TPA: pilin [Nevskiaceae bacterium]|nr:pilin [Nevskiaceae bacterium]
MNVTYGHQANTRIADDVLTLSPTTRGSINWRCFSTNLEPGHLPSVCR